MDQNTTLLSSAESALHAITLSIMDLSDIQATRHPYNGRAASIAITCLEDARYRTLDIISNLRAEENPAQNEHEE